MAIQTAEIKDNLRMAWLSFMEGLYAFSPRQRFVLVLGIVMIIPGYWLFRVGAKAGFGQVYKKYQVVAVPSFRNPVAPQVDSPVILPVAGGGYMAYAKVTNPNLKLSATSARYLAKFFNSKGQQVYQTSGAFYLLPGKSTYIVVPRFGSPELPVSGKISIFDTQWQQKSQVPDVELASPAPQVFADREGIRIEGVVINNSPYKLSAVRLVVLLYGVSDRVLAVSDRSEFAMLPSERRAYVLRFPGVFSKDVVRVVPLVLETNSADVSNVSAPDDRLVPDDITPKP